MSSRRKHFLEKLKAKRAAIWIGRGITLICVLFFLKILVKNWQSLPAEFFRADVWAVFLVSIFLYLLTFAMIAGISLILLDKSGNRYIYIKVLCVLLLSQLAKYLPGNVAHHIGRAAMLNQIGYPFAQAAFALFLEWVIALVVALGLVLAYLVLADNSFWVVAGVDTSEVSRAALRIILVSLGLIVFSFLGSSRLNALDRSDLHLPHLRMLLLVLLLNLVNFLIWGGIACAFLWTVSEGQSLNYWLLSATFALAWAIGFVTPGAPGGIGVREVVLLSLITPFYGSEIGLFLTIALRLLTVLGDIFAFLIGMFLRGQTSKVA